MRLATYVESAPIDRGSLVAMGVLAMAVFLGSTAALTFALYFSPALAPVVALAWVLCYLIAGCALMFEHGIAWVSWLVRYRIVLVLLLAGVAASTAWSISPWLTAERAVHLIGSSLVGIYIGYRLPLVTLMRVLALGLGAIVLASAAAAVALPDLAIREYQNQMVWSGVTSSKNTIGFWAAIGVFLFVALIGTYRSVSMKLACLGMVVICIAVLGMSQSATSLLALLIGGTLASYFFIGNRFALSPWQMAILAVLFGILLSMVVNQIDVAGIVGRSGDLTGRLEVWQQTWQLVMERPMTGYGYGTIWFPTDESLYIQQKLTEFTWVVYHAHNGFLQVASEIGLPLSALGLLMIMQQLIEIVHCQQQRQQAGVLFVLAFVVAFLVGNFSEARFLVNRELYWILFIALPLSMLRQVSVVEPSAAAGAAPRWRVRPQASPPAPVAPALPVSQAPRADGVRSGVLAAEPDVDLGEPSAGKTVDDADMHDSPGSVGRVDAGANGAGERRRFNGMVREYRSALQNDRRKPGDSEDDWLTSLSGRFRRSIGEKRRSGKVDARH